LIDAERRYFQKPTGPPPRLSYLFSDILGLAMDNMTFKRYGLVTVKNTAKHQYSRLRHDPYIEAEAHITYIKGIPLVTAEYALEAGSRPPVSPNLGNAGNARLGHMTELIIGDNGRKCIRIFQHMRAGTNNAHVSKEHINKLRDLIETCIAKELSDRGDTGIILDSLLAIRQVIHIHSAELITPEDLSEKSNPLLPEEYRAF